MSSGTTMFAAEYADTQVEFDVCSQVLKAGRHSPEKYWIRKPT